jgi:hypothetical protein
VVADVGKRFFFFLILPSELHSLKHSIYEILSKFNR